MYFCIRLPNPFKRHKFTNLYCKDERIPHTKNKNYSFEVLKENNLLFEFSLHISFTGQSHAGPELMIGVLGYSICARLYDSRHWDYDNGCWEEHHV